MADSGGVRGRRSISDIVHQRALMAQAAAAIDVENRVANLERRLPTIVLQIKVMTDEDVAFVGDGQFYLEISEDLDNYTLDSVNGWVSSATSGTLTMQVHNVGTGNDVLTTKLTITTALLTSKGGTAAVVDPAEEVMTWGDQLRFDIDGAGSTMKGLGVTLVFIP